MRHRIEKNKQKTTRKNPNKERLVDVRGNMIDYDYLKNTLKKKTIKNVK